MDSIQAGVTKKNTPLDRVREASFVLLVLGIALMMYDLVFTTGSGRVGHALTAMLLRFFGSMAYFIPGALLYCSWVLFRHWHKKTDPVLGVCLKLLGTGLFFVSLDGMTALCVGQVLISR